MPVSPPNEDHLPWLGPTLSIDANKKSRVLSGETTAAYLFKLNCSAGQRGPKEQWHFSSLGCKRPQIPLLPPILLAARPGRKPARLGAVPLTVIPASEGAAYWQHSCRFCYDMAARILRVPVKGRRPCITT